MAAIKSLLFFIIIIVIFHKVTALLHVNRTVIDVLSSTGCVLVGLNTLQNDLLEQLETIYSQEPTVHIVSGTADDISWETNNGVHAEIAFYKRQPSDRSCLLSTVHRVGVPYAGPLNIELMVSFINEHCNVYRTVNGGLHPEGILQQTLIDNLYNPIIDESYCNEVYSDDMTVNEFFWKYLSLSRPVIIRGGVTNWIARNKWTNDYLRMKYGHKYMHIKLTQDGIFEGVEEGSLWPGYSSDWIPLKVRSQLSFPELVVVRPATDEMKFGEFLNLISLGRNSSGVSAYLEYSSIPSYLPDLEGDINELPFVTNLKLKRETLNIWLSDGDTLGKLHFDPFDNFLCQLSGEKHLTLFSPHESANLYEAHIPEALLGYHKHNNTIYRKTLLTSTSMVMSPVDIGAPNNDRFPMYSKAKHLHCILKPGDVLFMPAFWWHEVQSVPDRMEGRNLAVNYWYQPFFTKEFPCPECKLEVNPIYKSLLTNPPSNY